MGEWSVIVPEATTNYVNDPSFEAASLTTYWTNSSLTTFAKSTTRAFRGYNSLHAISDNTGDYAYGAAITDADAAEVWTASCWVWVVTGNFRLTVQQNAGGYSDNATVGNSTTTGAWEYVSTTVTLGGGVTDARIKLGPGATAASEFYVDCVQLELAAYATTYSDGSQPGCTWAGMANASASTRSAQYRGGGRVVDLESTYGATVSAMSGFGLGPFSHNALDYALLPGGSFQSAKVGPRDLILTFTAIGASLAGLHSLRKDLVDLFKPDLVSPEQPVRLRYTGAASGTAVEIDGHYRDGLEGAASNRGHFERIAARFACYDPFFYEIGHGSAALATSVAVGNAAYFLGRGNITHGWSQTIFETSQPNGSVTSIVEAANGTLYIGGAFTAVGAIANTRGIVQYSPVTDAITAVGTGADNGVVYCLALGPDGALYAGGDFTQMGGVANTARVAKWNGANWTALSTGIGNGTVYELIVGRTGILYAGGNFTNHVDASGDYISQWSGSAWSSMGSGLDGQVRALAIGLDGSLYVGGYFTVSGAISLPYIGKWNGAAWTALGAGGDASVHALAVSPSGELFAGGLFTTMGGVSATYIARWNGSRWDSLGYTLDQAVYALAFLSDGLLFVGGYFTTVGSLVTTDRLAIWNGSSFVHAAVDLPGDAIVYAFCAGRDRLWVGFSTTGTGAGGTVNALTNVGTAYAYPRISVNRSGGTSLRAECIRNYITGETIWLNYGLLDGETLTIDLDYRADPTQPASTIPGRKRITSSYYSDVVGRALLAGSDFATLGLGAGVNQLLIYFSSAGTPTVTAWAEWRVPHWSADGPAA